MHITYILGSAGATLFFLRVSLNSVIEDKGMNTVDSLYLEHPLSRTSLYLELKSRSLCVGYNLFFSLYLELPLSRTNSLVLCEFEIERGNL